MQDRWSYIDLSLEWEIFLFASVKGREFAMATQCKCSSCSDTCERCSCSNCTCSTCSH
jgi:hypothetical protein